MSSVPKKADKLNLSLSLINFHDTPRCSSSSSSSSSSGGGSSSSSSSFIPNRMQTMKGRKSNIISTMKP